MKAILRADLCLFGVILVLFYGLLWLGVRTTTSDDGMVIGRGQLPKQLFKIYQTTQPF
jgi:hypothetical protein